MDYRRMAAGAAILAAISAAFFLKDARLASGLLAGVFTGALNFAAIAFTVKSLLPKGGNAAQPAGTAIAAVGVYFLKIAIIGAGIAVLVIYRELYSIKGFLIGFSATIALIFAEGVVASAKDKKREHN